MPDYYVLHVKEFKTDYPPDDLPCMRVQVLSIGNGVLVDEVSMNCIKDGDGGWYCPTPHGHGWTLFDSSRDSVSVWRRPHIAN